MMYEISIQARTNDSTGIIPDDISYDVRLHNISFSYPSRPDITVSCVSILYCALMCN